MLRSGAPLAEAGKAERRAPRARRPAGCGQHRPPRGRKPGVTEIAAAAPWQRKLRLASGWIGAGAAIGAFGAAVWLGATRGDAAVALLLATSALLVLGVVWVELRLQTAKELALIG